MLLQVRFERDRRNISSFDNMVLYIRSLVYERVNAKEGRGLIPTLSIVNAPIPGVRWIVTVLT